MNVICGNARCKYRRGLYCGLEFAMMNAAGCCMVWFDKRGNIRREPFYPPEIKPMDASEQRLPHLENMEEEVNSEKDVENAKKSKGNA